MRLRPPALGINPRMTRPGGHRISVAMGELAARVGLPLVSLAALTALACESTPAPVAPTAPAPTATAAAPEAAPEPPVDILGTVRWKSPEATLRALGSCANVPGAIAEGGAKALLEKLFDDALRHQVDGKDLAS